MTARLSSLALALLPVLSIAPSAMQAQSVPDPILVRGRQADVIVYAPIARDSAGDAVRLRQMLGGCAVGLGIAPEDSATAVDTPAPPFPLDVWQVRDAIVLAVLPAPERLIDCDDPRTQAALSPIRGLRVTLDTTIALAREVERVTVRHGARVLRPLVVERHAVRRLGASGFGPTREQWLRLAFDRREFSPAPDGTLDDLVVEVEYAAGDASERIALPWTAVRVAWESALAAQPLPGATAPMSRDRDARARVSFSLIELGDTASARVLGASLLRESPCVALHASAPEGARAVFGALARPAARCVAQKTQRTLLRAALLPGFARPGTGGRLDTRLLVFVASIGGAIAAVHQHGIARDRYDEYRAYQADPSVIGQIDAEVKRRYHLAERARHASINLGALSAVVWTGQGLLALRNERRFAAELRAVQGLGAAVSIQW